MPAETILIISTLVISIGDVLINLFGFCCTGRLKIDAPCIDIEHDDKPQYTLNPDDLNKIISSINEHKTINEHNTINEHKT